MATKLLVVDGAGEGIDVVVVLTNGEAVMDDCEVCCVGIVG